MATMLTHKPCTDEHLYRMRRSLQNCCNDHDRRANKDSPLPPETITQVWRDREATQSADILDST